MSSKHHDRSSSSKAHKPHKSSKSKAGASEGSNGSSTWPAAAEVSFLFVVNKMQVKFLSQEEGYDSGIRKDDWANVLPPANPAFYDPESPIDVSRVMRFRNGEVTAAGPAYRWARQGQFGEGYIAMAAGGTEYALTRYKSASVFSCNPSLPIITLDGDARTQPEPEFHALQFLHPPADNISQAAFSPHYYARTGEVPVSDMAGAKYVAGRNASWIPSLVPDTCRNLYPARQSQGLGGELPIVIGLMAFHADGRSVNDVFLGRGESSSGWWRHYRWRGPQSSPPGYTLSEHDNPRGYLVHVCLDPENQVGSTMETLAMLEWNSVLVQG